MGEFAHQSWVGDGVGELPHLDWLQRAINKRQTMYNCSKDNMAPVLNLINLTAL